MRIKHLPGEVEVDTTVERVWVEVEDTEDCTLRYRAIEEEGCVVGQRMHHPDDPEEGPPYWEVITHWPVELIVGVGVMMDEYDKERGE